MRTIKVVTMKHDIILGQYADVTEIGVPVSKIRYYNSNKKIKEQNIVIPVPQVNPLYRQDDNKNASQNHKKTETKHGKRGSHKTCIVCESQPTKNSKHGPRETYIAYKKQTGKRRMRPTTRAQRHITNQELRTWLSIEKNPFSEYLDIEFTMVELPVQHGSKQTNLHKQTEIIQDAVLFRRRNKKAVIQNFNKSEILLPIDYCYELYGTVDRFCDTPIIDYFNKMDELRSADAVPPVSKEELEQARKQALQQRFDDCVRALYYPETHEK